MSDLYERLLTYNEKLFFGQWRLDGATPDEALLGKGSFGRVFGVYREETDSAGALVRYTAAIKVIPIDDVNLRIQRDMNRAQKQKILSDELRYVQKEIEIMRRLEGESNIAYFQNSEIIRRTDTELECWDVLICMEKLVVLRDHLKATNLAPGSYPYLMQVLHIWREISTALSVCEKSAILHTDVKPANVFYAPGPDHYKLSDFGTSISGNTFRPGIRYGTNDYMSPEMYHKKGGDSRTDLYSLAVMIYELLNGNNLPLQHGNSREAAWRERLEDLKQIPPLKGVPDDVNAVLLRCLDCDPKRRYARCSDVADAVMALYLQYKTRGSIGGAGKKNKWLVPAVAGVLAVGAIGIGLGVVLGSEKEQPPAVEATQTNAPALYASMTLDEASVSFPVGGAAQIEGWLNVLEGEVQVENVALFADGSVWPTSVEAQDGAYRFRAELGLAREGEFDLEVSLRLRDDPNTVLAAQNVHFIAIRETAAPTEVPTEAPTEVPTEVPTEAPTNVPTAVPAETPTPTPTAEPTPAPVIELEAEGPVMCIDGSAEVEGFIAADVTIRPEELELWVNGEVWPILAQAQDDGRYAFSARGEVSETTTGLQLQARYLGAQSETVGLPVEVFVPTPTPVPVLTLALNETEIMADSSEITISGTVATQGEVSASELLLSVNGSAVEALWDPTDGGIDFSASISMDLEGVEALEIKVRSRASDDIAAATGTIAVRQIEATPEPTVEPFSPILIDDFETLNQRWIGAENVLVMKGSAQPGEALDVTINGRLFGSYAVEDDGSFAVDILSGAWQSGENEISIAYSRAPEGSGDQSAAFSVYFDADAPVIAAQETIDQHTEALRVRVEDMDENVRVFAQIDGAAQIDGVRSEEESPDGKAAFDIALPMEAGESPLTAQSKIEIVAMDSAGNIARQAVAFQRALDEITFLNTENLISTYADVVEWRRLTDPSFGVLRGKATPNTTLRLSVGESAWSLETSEDGSFEWEIDVSAFAEGMNTVAVEYETCDGAPVEAGTGRVEIQIQADGFAPVLNVQPAILMQGVREIQVTVEEEASICCFDLLIDGKLVGDLYVLQADRLAGESTLNYVDARAEQQGVRVQKTDGQTCTLTIPEDIELTENSDIVVEAIDGAGNIAVVTLLFEQIAPIEIVNVEELGNNWRNDAEVTIALQGEPRASVSVVINEDSITALLDENGMWEDDITEWLRQGVSNIMVNYADQNGYPQEVVWSTSNATYVSYDTEPPKAEVSPAVITRDTTRLTLTVPNEPYGYWYALYVDENAVVGGDAAEESVVIDGIDELNLRKAERIVLVVGDAINEPVEIELAYQDVSEKVEAYVFPSAASGITVSAGETVPLDVVVLCSDYDMVEGYVTMSLTDESGTRRNCTFTREKLSAEEYAQLVEQADANISDYVNSAYRITGVNVPEDCAGGKYTVCMKIEAEHETYDCMLNALTVEESVKGTRVKDPFVDVSEGSQYAIGFDEPLQNAFRADNIVLTGGVCRPEGQTMYYNRYEIEDSHHRLLYTSYISGEEFTQVPRAVNDLASLYNEIAEEPIVAETEDAGFVLSIDLSGAGLIDGEEYSLVLYTSNKIDGAWPTLVANILIDSGANEIGEEDIAEITQAWEAELRAAEELLLAQQLAAEEAAQAADAQQP